MNTRFQKGLIVAVVIGLSMAGISSAMAQSYLDGSAKARGDYGQMSRSQSRPTYRYMAPSPQRSFSYEPAQAATQSSQPSTGCGCGDTASVNAANNSAPHASVAQRGTQTYRAYSYEPGMTTGSMGSRSGSTPLWALPKTDSRKFGGGR